MARTQDYTHWEYVIQGKFTQYRIARAPDGQWSIHYHTYGAGKGFTGHRYDSRDKAFDAAMFLARSPA